MSTLALLPGALGALSLLLHLASTCTMMARLRRRTESPDVLPGISIIRPVCGIDNFARETLSSGFQLDYPDYELLFCVAAAGDPVVPLVQTLIAAHPHVPARLLVGNDPVSPNPKLNNTVKGFRAARHRWIVMADSNVLMPPDYLQQLLSAWRPDCGLVCSPPAGGAPRGLWAELECAFLNTYQARWQCFADSIGLGFAQGKTMLWRRDILEAGGGIEALGDELAEDAAATKLVRRQGLRVRLVDAPFLQPLGRRTAVEVWQRQLRWARLRRDTFRVFFLPELLAGGLPPLIACAVM
ncbi:MAG: ceramide glucosyltransferase, partial [Proteobacteria bacterium]